MNYEDYEIEGRNASIGLNPMMGEWQVTIAGRPVPYSGTSNTAMELWRIEIKKAIGGNRSWIYSHQVSLSIDLYVDYQSMMETNEIGDLDNYAKLICDSLKGNGGIVVDDCQFQRLDVAWIDAPNRDHEEVILRFRAAPDDFFLLPIKIYEMSDGLFYPFPDNNWTAHGPVAVSSSEREMRLVTADALTRAKKLMRHSERKVGSPQFRSVQKTRHLWDPISRMMGGYAFV
jgi:Holliday junction resolvase RusA-like endonuclease